MTSLMQLIPRRLGRLLVGALFACGTQVAAQAPRGDQLPVREVTLDNGMRFLVLPQDGAPTVAFVTQYAVGGANEHLGTTGIAHLLEHLLFKGTTTIGTMDLAAERALFAEMDAAHDTLVRARGRVPVPDRAEIERLETRIASLEDSARAFVVPNEYSEILERSGARGINATTSLEATQYFVELPANRANCPTAYRRLPWNWQKISTR